jgi:nucleotide-binding universal stress UspA family protein
MTPITTSSEEVRATAWEEISSDRALAGKTGATIDLVPQLLHMQRVLVPIDFSASAEKALDYAIPFAEQFGAKITVLHILELPTPSIDFVVYDLDREGYQIAAQQHLDSITRKRISNASPETITTTIRSGIPWLEICKAAKELDAGLIILTTHGHTGLKRVLLGSTAERVVRHAPCPVLVVREKEREFV